MREAVGGSLLLYLIIPIIVLFIVFIGFIMNYAAAYRAANYVVSQYENCQGYVGKCGNVDDDAILSHIKSKYHYHGLGNSKNLPISCIANGSNAVVYRVTLPVQFELPIFGEFAPFNVVAETKTIHNRSCK